MEVVETTIAKIGQVTAGFEAKLAVIALEKKKALETSEILLLKSVERREKAKAFFLPFLLVTRMKETSSVSGISTTISTSGKNVGIRLEP